MRECRLLAVGDISLKTRNQADPFSQVKDVLHDKSVLFGNLETALSERGRESEKSVILSVPASMARYLRNAGFDVVNIANNHVMDRGREGFDDTLQALAENKIAFIGGGNSIHNDAGAIVERDGLRLGFLGYSDSGFTDKGTGIFLNRIAIAAIRDDIAVLKKNCASIIVSLHWGIENVRYPSIAQIGIAREIIDCGATVVLGHHPHILQGIERYKHGLIAYSLGNFQFQYDIGQNFGKIRQRTNLTIILAITLTSKGLKSFEPLPVKISEDYSPIAASGSEKENILHFISEVSRPVSENALNARKWFDETAEVYIRDSLFSWKRRTKLYGIEHSFLFLLWLARPFVIRCYITLAMKWLCHKSKALPMPPEPKGMVAGDLKEAS